ncbi:MAG: hypothetical protein ABI852_10725 [Gemmatimonadaceae bacterium]
MKKTIPLIALLATVAVAACAGTPSSDPSRSPDLNNLPVLPATISLAAGASTDVASANLRIRFDSVSGESRCPSDVQCVQAGSATVRLTVSQLSGVMSAQLLSLTTIAGKDTATSYGQPVRLVNVTPTPISTAPTAQSAYRIELKVGAGK